MHSAAVAPRFIPILSRNKIRSQTASSIYSCAYRGGPAVTLIRVYRSSRLAGNDLHRDAIIALSVDLAEIDNPPTTTRGNFIVCEFSRLLHQPTFLTQSVSKRRDYFR